MTTALTDGQTYGSELVSRTAVCRHLSFTAGHCPNTPGTVAVSDRSLRALGLRAGEQLTLVPPKTRRPVELRITGVFRAGNPQAPYWWGENYFGFGSSVSPAHPVLDDAFATEQTVFSASPRGETFSVAQLPLVTQGLVAQGVSTFERSMTSYERRSRAVFAVNVSSQIAGLLSRSAEDQHVMTTIVVVVDVQLVLLSLLVLYFVAARTAEARDPDVQLAELRGFPPSGLAAVSLLEPLAVLGAAVPVGVIAAWLTATLVGPHLFTAGAAPAVTPVAVGAALLCFAAGVVAATLGARDLVRPKGSLIQRNASRAPGQGRLGVAADAVAVAFAVAAFVEVAAAGVSSGSHTDPVAAFAPGLLAFGAGVVGARLLPLGARATIRITRDSRWVGAALATRRVARRAELSRHVVVLSIAVGLAAFAVTGWAVADQNRTVRSEFDVGADRVLSVQARPGVNFLRAVRRADPTGHRAMAAVLETAPDGELLAVDATRMASVASWPTGLGTQPLGTIARRLAPPTAPPVVFSGATLRVSVHLLRDVSPAPELEATVFDDAYQTSTTLDLGALEVDRSSYESPTAGACAESCRLVNLALVWTPSGSEPQQSIAVPLTVSGVVRTVLQRIVVGCRCRAPKPPPLDEQLGGGASRSGPVRAGGHGNRRR